MIAAIFDVTPEPSRREDFAIAAALRPRLERIDGLLSVERFASLSNEGKILSLSSWRDEEAAKAWRTLPEHRAAQDAGRGGIVEYGG